MNGKIFEGPDTLEESGAPWDNVFREDFHVVVYLDKYPVTKGHLLFVPKYNSIGVLKDAFEDAIREGQKMVEAGEWNGGINSGNPNAVIDVAISKYQFLDTETNKIIKITKWLAREQNKTYGYKRLVHIQKKNIKCVDQHGNYYKVKLEEYNPSVHRAYNANTFTAFDTADNIQKIISRDTYLLNKNRYLTSTKGKVLAKDKNGVNMLVTKDEFNSGDYVGQTAGLTTVFDKTLNKYIQITKDEFIKNKANYTGPNTGKVNVINKYTGERTQISKEIFDKNKNMYVGLGNKTFLFLCQNRLTGREKLVNIYEWDLIKDQYEIIDKEKFDKAMLSKLN